MKRDKGAIAALIFQGTKRLRELLGEKEVDQLCITTNTATNI
jgi:hypothetical protein